MNYGIYIKCVCVFCTTIWFVCHVVFVKVYSPKRQIADWSSVFNKHSKIYVFFFWYILYQFYFFHCSLHDFPIWAANSNSPNTKINIVINISKVSSEKNATHITFPYIYKCSINYTHTWDFCLCGVVVMNWKWIVVWTKSL